MGLFFLLLLRPLFRVIDNGNDFTDLYLLAFGHFRFEHAGIFPATISVETLSVSSAKAKFAFVH